MEEALPQLPAGFQPMQKHLRDHSPDPAHLVFSGWYPIPKSVLCGLWAVFYSCPVSSPPWWAGGLALTWHQPGSNSCWSLTGHLWGLDEKWMRISKGLSIFINISKLSISDFADLSFLFVCFLGHCLPILLFSSFYFGFNFFLAF